MGILTEHSDWVCIVENDLFTIGKIYKLENTLYTYDMSTSYKLIDDNGNAFSIGRYELFNQKNFIPISEWRNLQLAKLDI